VPELLGGGIGLREEHRQLAGGRDAAQSVLRSKKNDAVTAPRAAHRAVASTKIICGHRYWSIAQHQRNAAGNVKPLQLAAGEERDRLAVRSTPMDIPSSPQCYGAGVFPIQH